MSWCCLKSVGKELFFLGRRAFSPRSFCGAGGGCPSECVAVVFGWSGREGVEPLGTTLSVVVERSSRTQSSYIHLSSSLILLISIFSQHSSKILWRGEFESLLLFAQTINMISITNSLNFFLITQILIEKYPPHCVDRRSKGRRFFDAYLGD